MTADAGNAATASNGIGYAQGNKRQEGHPEDFTAGQARGQRRMKDCSSNASCGQRE